MGVKGGCPPLRRSMNYFLVDLYGVNEATSEKALGLMKAKLDEIDDKIEKISGS